MKNNKLTRKREMRRLERLAKQEPAAVMPDGTEVLKSKEARQKVRRWTFEANVSLVLPEQKDADGKVTRPQQEMPLRRMKLEQTSFCAASEIKGEVKSVEENLKRTNALFAAAKLNVVAIPHETVSNATLNQLTGYRDMSMILDRALQLAITEAQDVVSGKAVGSQFIEAEAVAEDKEKSIEAKPARTIGSIKEDFYKRALDEIKKGMEQPVVAEAVAEPAPEPEKESFEQLKERLTTEA